MPITLNELLVFVRQHTSLTKSESHSLAEQARHPEYWTSLCEGMTIGASGPVDAHRDVPTDVLSAINDYREYGHCTVHDAFSLADIELLERAVTRVHQAGWPMIFAFVFDQFWEIARSFKIEAFARSLLGPRYQPTVSFWVNYVAAARGHSGFPPHLDDVRPGHPAVTCWVPLRSATPDNGCIYVIERASDGQNGTMFLDNKTLSSVQVRRTLLRVRALPADRGSFLAWPNDTLHWGGIPDRLA
jgi:hypothetical protein